MAEEKMTTAQAVNALEVHIRSLRSAEHLLGVLQRVQAAEQDVEEAKRKRLEVLKAISLSQKQLDEINAALKNAKESYNERLDLMAKETAKTLQETADAATKAIAEYNRQVESAKNAAAIEEARITKEIAALKEEKAGLEKDMRALEDSLAEVSSRVGAIQVKARRG